MPNAIKMLQDDQNSARILFGQVQQVPAGQSGTEDKAALQLASMLSTHNTLVEEFIHPLLQKFEPTVADESEGGYGQTRRLPRSRTSRAGWSAGTSWSSCRASSRLRAR